MPYQNCHLTVDVKTFRKKGVVYDEINTMKADAECNFDNGFSISSNSKSGNLPEMRVR